MWFDAEQLDCWHNNNTMNSFFKFSNKVRMFCFNPFDTFDAFEHKETRLHFHIIILLLGIMHLKINLKISFFLIFLVLTVEVMSIG